MRKIKQKFHHFSKWEDFKGGLYKTNVERYGDKVQMSADLLSNQDEFFDVAIEMFSKWVYSTEQNLTDNMINKKAWIGQASCCFNHQAPDYATIEAWWSLSDEIKVEANNTAKKALKKWQSEQVMKDSLWQS